MLGTPTVVSDVGGVKNMIDHEKEGYVYQHDASYMIDIMRADFLRWEQKQKKITDQARRHASQIFDIEKNIGDLVAITRKSAE